MTMMNLVPFLIIVIGVSYWANINILRKVKLQTEAGAVIFVEMLISFFCLPLLTIPTGYLIPWLKLPEKFWGRGDEGWGVVIFISLILSQLIAAVGNSLFVLVKSIGNKS